MAHCLRRADANKMVNSEWNMGLSGIMECPFTPVQEGNFFPDTPATALARENFKKTKITCYDWCEKNPCPSKCLISFHSSRLLENSTQFLFWALSVNIVT